LELKSAADKASSIKSPTGGMAQPASGSGFGINAFVDSSGGIGSKSSDNDQYLLPEPDQMIEPKFKPVDITVKPENKNSKKNCVNCKSSISLTAKFCPKCGNSQ
jgi:hypothetical protein